MCWQCDNPDGTTEEYLDVLRATIRDHGWAVQYVESENRPFAYTVGLPGRGLPELLMTGLPADTACRVLNSIAHMIVDDGTLLTPAMHIDYEDRFLIEVVEVEHPDVHLKPRVAPAMFAEAFSRPTSPAVQSLFGYTGPRVFAILGRWFDAEIRAGRMREQPTPLLVQQLLGPIMFHLFTRPLAENASIPVLPDVDTVCDVFAENFLRAVTIGTQRSVTPSRERKRKP